jgi:predicted dehydrogenase
MINWIQKELPAEVTAVLSNVMHDNSEVEDLSFAILKYADGALAEVTASVVHHGGTQSVVLQCENAKIAAPFAVAAEKSKSNGFGEANTELEEQITEKYNALPTRQHEGFDGEIDNVLTAIETNTELEEQITEKYNALPTRQHEGFDGEIDDVLNAIETNTRPLISGEDGRNTVELITAIYKSGCTKQTVSLPLAKDDEFYTSDWIQKHAIRFYKKAKSETNLGDNEITLGKF